MRQTKSHCFFLQRSLSRSFWIDFIWALFNISSAKEKLSKGRLSHYWCNITRDVDCSICSGLQILDILYGNSTFRRQTWSMTSEQMCVGLLLGCSQVHTQFSSWHKGTICAMAKGTWISRGTLWFWHGKRCGYLEDIHIHSCSRNYFMEFPASTGSLNFMELPAPKVHLSYKDFQWSPLFGLPMYLPWTSMSLTFWQPKVLYAWKNCMFHARTKYIIVWRLGQLHSRVDWISFCWGKVFKVPSILCHTL